MGTLVDGVSRIDSGWRGSVNRLVRRGQMSRRRRFTENRPAAAAYAGVSREVKANLIEVYYMWI